MAAIDTMEIAPHATIGNATLYLGKSEIVLVGLPSNSIGGCVTDPPYHLTNRAIDTVGCPQCQNWGERKGGYGDHLPGDPCPICATPMVRRRSSGGGGFMGKDWDGGGIAFSVELWREVYRVLKPGAYLAAFSGSRTYHRMAVAIEDAGFIIRDMIEWNYGTGFPKSHNISKAIDKKAGATRGKKKVIASNPKAIGQGQDGAAGATRPYIERALAGDGYHEVDDDTPITELAAQWDGYGTALKPGHEPIVLAQKPLEGTYAANVEKWGVGALNIDKCRIATGGIERAAHRATGNNQIYGDYGDDTYQPGDSGKITTTAGRYPPNILLTHSLFCIPGTCDPACPVGQLDKQGGGVKKSSANVRHNAALQGTVYGQQTERITTGHGDTGGVSRFFPILDWSEDDYWWFKYLPKPTKSERNAGTIDADTGEGGNTHVTVKPLSVMGWLLDLCIPKGQTVIDPFAGSGTTLCAARQRKIASIGIDMEPDHLAIQIKRLNANTIAGWE